MTGKPAHNASPLMRMALDIGPLIVFFAVYLLAPSKLELARLLTATVAFMLAMGAALILSWWKTGHISPMLWISAVLVLILGSLTLYFHNEAFIKMKPTLVYLLFSLVLGYGLWSGKPLLELVLGQAYPGLSARGWRLLTINWTVFFIVMAMLNEAIWRTQTTTFWASYKLWGAIPLTMLFAAGNIPMLLRNGLNLGDDEPTPPVE